MIAYCGLMCSSCQVYLATLEQDEYRKLEMRESIAEQCRIIYGMNLKAGEISDCEGCRTADGRIFSGCVNCGIRKCAANKKIENCAYCTEYACEILKEHFLHDPQSQITLGEIRKLNGDIFGRGHYS